MNQTCVPELDGSIELFRNLPVALIAGGPQCDSLSDGLISERQIIAFNCGAVALCLRRVHA